MTKEEFSRIAAKMVLNWDNIGKGKLQLFYEKFGTLPPALWAQVVNRAVDTETFVPAVATLKNHLVEILQPRLPEAAEQWALVRRAIGRASYHSAEDFAALPEIVQKCVGSPDQLKAWGSSDSYSEDVARSNFIKAYNRMAEQRKRDMQAANTPEELCRIAVEQFGNGPGLPKIGAKAAAAPEIPAAEAPGIAEGPREVPPEAKRKLDALKESVKRR